MCMYFFQKVSLPSDLNIHKLKLSCPRSGPLQSLPSDDVFYDTTDSMAVGPDSDSDGGVATERRPRYCTLLLLEILSLFLFLSLFLSSDSVPVQMSPQQDATKSDSTSTGDELSLRKHKTVAIDTSQNASFTHRLLPAQSPEFDNVINQVIQYISVYFCLSLYISQYIFAYLSILQYILVYFDIFQ